MPRLKEDRIKSRLTQQSSNIPIVNQDEAYEIKLVQRYIHKNVCFSFLLFSRFLNVQTFKLAAMGEFIYPQRRNNNNNNNNNEPE